jgi:hypothetical protein
MNLPITIASVFIVASVALDQGQADVIDCTITGNSSKCTFDPSQLNLGWDSAFPVFDTNGEIFECDAVVTQNGWYGEQCTGNAKDANFITSKDQNGLSKVFGSLRISTDICSIQPNANGTEGMLCTPETEFPPEQDGLEPPDDGDEEYEGYVRNLHVGFDPTISEGGAENIHGRLLYDDSGTNIDVMVVWTNDAECANSKLPRGCTLTAITESNMRGLIDLAVSETNTAFSQSGILSSLRLVYAYRDPTYAEPTTFDEALGNLRSTSDGKLDSVHTLRSLYGADLVQMIVGTYSRKTTP